MVPKYNYSDNELALASRMEFDGIIAGALPNSREMFTDTREVAGIVRNREIKAQHAANGKSILIIRLARRDSIRLICHARRNDCTFLQRPGNLSTFLRRVSLRHGVAATAASSLSKNR